MSLFPFSCSLIGFVAKLSFPIKAPATMAQIHFGVDVLAAGGVVTDPVTRKRIQRPVITEEEVEAMWLLENFAPAVRNTVVVHGGVLPLVTRMQRWVAFSATLCACLAAGMVVSLVKMVNNPSFSIFSTLSVIATSFSACWLYICVVGLIDAERLMQMESKFVVELVKKLGTACGYTTQP
jgi:hypothetical protein